MIQGCSGIFFKLQLKRDLQQLNTAGSVLSLKLFEFLIAVETRIQSIWKIEQ
jgi:hypothetical protein